ncbi:MAG: prolyl oligopeptidase family serine peptidase, partial [Deltaproteobacteria bacterium]|nr:prolyl oligopeptidase family serine peptidase [Deltaproteobacteria bacterium]
RAVADRADLISDWAMHGDRLYLLSAKGASNRQLLSVPLADPDLAKARVEVAESPEIVLVGFAIARDGLYLRQMIEGRARIVRRPWRGGRDTTLALPFEGWIPGLASDDLADGVTFALQGWTRPSTIYAVRGTTVVPTGLATTSSADYSNIQVDQVVVTSPDGARVPLSILRRKDLVLDGSHPTYLYGYGAYGASQTPGFNPSRLAWLERGGIAAIAHVRGGGEKGRAWQDTGTREHKLSGIRDFIACGEYLIAQKYTTASRLVAMGASMGGILVGRAVMERPDLFAAASIGAGIVNPIRILLAENGANQKVELGDPTTEAGYRSIATIDPYLHVRPNTKYPALIFTVGLNDHRVAPWMTAKLAARIQRATSSKQPILVRVETSAGHGIGSTADQYAAERADVWSVFLAITGDPAFALKP